MKYWNKSKRTRQQCWTAVQRPIVWSRIPGGNAAFPEMQRIDEMKLWCQQQASTGRFYFKGNDTTWWFELGKDATWFVLNWSSNGN